MSNYDLYIREENEEDMMCELMEGRAEDVRKALADVQRARFYLDTTDGNFGEYDLSDALVRAIDVLRGELIAYLGDEDER